MNKKFHQIALVLWVDKWSHTHLLVEYNFTSSRMKSQVVDRKFGDLNFKISQHSHGFDSVQRVSEANMGTSATILDVFIEEVS